MLCVHLLLVFPSLLSTEVQLLSWAVHFLKERLLQAFQELLLARQSFSKVLTRAQLRPLCKGRRNLTDVLRSHTVAFSKSENALKGKDYTSPILFTRIPCFEKASSRPISRNPVSLGADKRARAESAFSWSQELQQKPR